MNDFEEAALRLTAIVRRTTACLAALGAIMATAPSVSAQTAFTLPAPPLELPMLPSPSGNWTVMVGIGGEYKPEFVGSNNGKFLPIPIFSIRRAGSIDQFRGPRDSASIALLDVGNFRAGPAFKYVASRKADKYAELTGLGNVDAAYELGGFVEYYPVDWLRLRSELRQGMGGHTGTVADVSADVIVPLIQRLTISAGPRFTWKSANATAPYFGVTDTQALASGLPRYDARGGAHSVGFGSQISYRINPQWEVHAYVEYQKLLGDVADSPLVKLRGSSNQTTVGLGASYSFDFRIR
ncbi:MipA/OmpV family protein [Bradyrhizobium yuanmingense]|uniref:MipA/OmpV family protein n=1 Tax=Bradyrhizobium yuanmingense TaxID=108015 RepID=UPI0023B8A5A7|nr:MipA/OmpV family protein [Bradyrhizobium yuanmingense]MDF0498062.1 MipA/OmpV family protein [Bradyrhizobium yuanmingense]